MNLNTGLIEKSRAIQEDLVRWRREIHQIAELGNNTFETAKVVKRELLKMGVPEKDIRLLVNGAGVAAVIHGEKPGKCLGIRVDCDALPMMEEADVSFKATNGNTHSCGHDSHTAMGLGAAKLLLGMRDQFQGSVKIMFQPGEETLEGAKAMIDEGVLEAPRVDAAIGCHCAIVDARLPEFPCGSIATTTGFPASACSTSFKAVIHGKGAHGSTPYDSVDPIFIGAAAIMQLQGIISREHNTLEKAVLSVCRVESGTANNIIPSSLTLEGTIRTLDHKYSMKILDRIRTICTSVAESMGGSCSVECTGDMSETLMDPEMLKVLRESAAKIVGEGKVYTITEPTLGGEDFAVFSRHVPTVHFCHSQRFDDGREQFPNHNPKFIACEDGYWTAAATLVQFALDWLGSGK